MNVLGLALILTLSHLIVSSPLGPKKEPELLAADENQRVINYLRQFGYVENARSYNNDQVREGLKKLQNFFKLPETGVADKATLELIEKPRCGFPDIITNHNRFVIAGEGFYKKNITYRFGKYSPKLPQNEVDENVKLALEMWAESSNLTFTKVDARYDILLSFVQRQHGDQFPFDGPGKNLAHAFMPTAPLSGDVHFDEEENWKIMTSPSEQGTDFFSVVVHELGHSLGLAHSQVWAAVMAPIYKYVDKQIGLHDDDKLGIYSIYVLGLTP